jgi:hypothetical protein
MPELTEDQRDDLSQLALVGLALIQEMELEDGA